MSAYKSLLSPLKIKHLELKNRVASAAHACTFAQSGKPGAQAYHEEKARGGIGLTMFGGSSNVAVIPDRSTGRSMSATTASPLQGVLRAYPRP